jgi:hypothetical protein
MASWAENQLMQATERLLQIEVAFSIHVARIVPIELDGETIRLVLYFRDGTNLRVAEHWNENQLVRYSYYWLTAANEIKVGWDNAPHHTHLATFPHHKHIGPTGQLEPSSETSLEAVMAYLLDKEIDRESS